MAKNVTATFKMLKAHFGVKEQVSECFSNLKSYRSGGGAVEKCRTFGTSINKQNKGKCGVKQLVLETEESLSRKLLICWEFHLG
jgi:hypothetical protein